MADIAITQTEADALIRLPKIPADKSDWSYPPLGGAVSIPLTSKDKREDFLLDISRGQINLSRGKYQNRARYVIVLVRLDFGGPPHRNPDGEEIACPHLHIYKEGYGDKWAYPVSIDEFPNIDDTTEALYDFMRFCNVIEFPNIQIGLFT
jgi:hypothetical protein